MRRSSSHTGGVSGRRFDLAAHAACAVADTVRGVRMPSMPAPDRSWTAIRRGLAALVLLLLPGVLYLGTITEHYGLRDDYSILREAHEEPGKVTGWCASQGRPLYGLVLEATFGELEGLDDLPLARALTAVAVGVVSLLGWAAFRRAGWTATGSFAFAALLSVLPAAQIDVSWAVCFPHVLAAVAGMAAFLVADAERWRRRAGGAVLVACGALFYQPHALLYVAPVAAGLVARRHEPVAARARWLAVHLTVLASGLVLAFAVMQALFASGLAAPSHLWAFDLDPLAKLRWFLDQPLHNALALIVLRDETRDPSTAYWCMVAGVAAAIAVAVVGELRRGGVRAAAFLVLCVAGLAIASFAANLIAEERTPKYRTLWALGAVCTAFAAQGLATLGDALPKHVGRHLATAAIAALALAGVPLARSQTYELIAEPQERELALVEQSLRLPLLRDDPSMFVIRPRPGDTIAPLRFEDEFGSLSSDSDWVPTEMLKAVIEERAPSLCDAPRPCRITTGLSVPPGARYDLVIDLRNLTGLRPRAEGSSRPG